MASCPSLDGRLRDLPKALDKPHTRVELAEVTVESGDETDWYARLMRLERLAT